VSAEQSVKNWLAFRSERNPSPGQDALANWLAYRENLAATATAENRPQERSRDPEITGAGHRDGAPADRDPRRGRKNDLGY
jgi:hypothetical protein